MIYLITINYYSGELIARLLESIQASPANDGCYQLIIVNNSPVDPSLAALTGAPVFILNNQKNLGFGSACNVGLNWVFTHNPGAIVWLINPDTCLTADALKNAREFFQLHPEAAIVGTVVNQPDGQLWFGGGSFQAQTGEIFSQDLFEENPQADYLACDWVTGCSLLVNLAKFKRCPEFDPYYFLYYEDFDFCRRYHAQGYTIGITQQIQVIHYPSSVTDRAPAIKLKYSTDSYLFTLERYTSRLILILRLMRLVVYALLLLPVKPPVAIGKLQGVLLYLQRVNHRGGKTAD